MRYLRRPIEPPSHLTGAQQEIVLTEASKTPLKNWEVLDMVSFLVERRRLKGKPVPSDLKEFTAWAGKLVHAYTEFTWRGVEDPVLMASLIEQCEAFEARKTQRWEGIVVAVGYCIEDMKLRWYEKL